MLYLNPNPGSLKSFVSYLWQACSLPCGFLWIPFLLHTPVLDTWKSVITLYIRPLFSEDEKFFCFWHSQVTAILCVNWKLTASFNLILQDWVMALPEPLPASNRVSMFACKLQSPIKCCVCVFFPAFINIIITNVFEISWYNFEPVCSSIVSA